MQAGGATWIEDETTPAISNACTRTIAEVDERLSRASTPDANGLTQDGLGADHRGGDVAGASNLVPFEAEQFLGFAVQLR